MLLEVKYKFLLIIIISIFIYNCEKETIKSSSLSDEYVRKLKRSDTVEDVFYKSAKIKLNLTPESSFGYITDFEVDSVGNFIIADGWMTRQVYVFSSKGQFLKILGKRGLGPAEYQTPVSIEIDKGGNIWVSDYTSNKVIIYDDCFQFTKYIIFKPRIKYYIHLNSKGWVYSYLGQLYFRNKEQDLIYLYNTQGQLIKSFAPMLNEIRNVNFSVIQDGMAIDKDDYIYEMSPIFYKIRKYDPEGVFIKSFPRNPINFSLNRKNPLILNGPFYLERGLIISQIKNRIDIFDTEGNYIISLPFRFKIVSTKENKMYVICESEKSEEIINSNPEIICYELKI